MKNELLKKLLINLKDNNIQISFSLRELLLIKENDTYEIINEKDNKKKELLFIISILYPKVDKDIKNYLLNSDMETSISLYICRIVTGNKISQSKDLFEAIDIIKNIDPLYVNYLSILFDNKDLVNRNDFPKILSLCCEKEKITNFLCFKYLFENKIILSRKDILDILEIYIATKNDNNKHYIVDAMNSKLSKRDDIKEILKIISKSHYGKYTLNAALKINNVEENKYYKILNLFSKIKNSNISISLEEILEIPTFINRKDCIEILYLLISLNNTHATKAFCYEVKNGVLFNNIKSEKLKDYIILVCSSDNIDKISLSIQLLSFNEFVNSNIFLEFTNYLLNVNTFDKKINYWSINGINWLVLSYLNNEHSFNIYSYIDLFLNANSEEEVEVIVDILNNSTYQKYDDYKKIAIIKNKIEELNQNITYVIDFDDHLYNNNKIDDVLLALNDEDLNEDISSNTVLKLNKKI